jgi:tRNA modification GTPase
LLDQYHGAFARAIQDILAALAGSKATSGGRLLEELAQNIEVGRHLTVPWRVVVAGAPNVGKSSLVNALAGYQRSVVSPIPGTTRDVVGTPIAVDGWPIELSDTAGWRENAEALEEKGIRLAEGAVAAADLCLWVVDGANAATPLPKERGIKHRVQPVINKIDLQAAWDWTQVPNAIQVSALTGAGLADLCREIGRRLVPDPPSAGAAVPFTPALCDGIETAQRLWLAGRIEDVRGVLQGLLHCTPGHG